MYYLQSRYYDPEIGRFLNADAYTSTGQGILGNNMFAYCLNNPVKYADTQGYMVVDCFDTDGEMFSNDDERGAGHGGPSSRGPSGNGETSSSGYSYTPTAGGGGPTSSINVGNTTVTFCHGGRHMDFNDISGLEGAIANDVVTRPPTTGIRGEVIINYCGTDFTYRYWTIDGSHINVGTYFYTVAK